MTKLLTADEVAERLRVNKQWLYDETNQGRFPGFKLGRLWRCSEQDLIAYIERLRRAA